jgi:hypothetical protein
VVARIVALLVVAATLPVLDVQVSAAASSDVVINELMYHPESDVEIDDYLELHNPTGDAVDVGGWCFTSGVSGCLQVGTSIAPGGFLVVARSPVQATTTYGIPVSSSYGGNLNNSGETVTVVDAGGDEVDSVTYSDAAPWPLTPDGDGPSLERRGPELDGHDDASWGASEAPAGHTAGAANSIGPLLAPSIDALDLPSPALPDGPLIVSVLSPEATEVSLEVVVDHDPASTVPAVDDGVGADAAAGDGRFTAALPAQPEGSLLRVRASASAGGPASTVPTAGDSQQYRGVVVTTGTGQVLPRVHLYMADGAYEDMVTNHVQDDQTFPVVIAVGDQVFDDGRVRVRGSTTRVLPRKSLKVELPSGYELAVPGLVDEPVDEFNLTADWYDWSYVRLPPTWDLFAQEGFPELQVFKARVQLDGELLGAYTFMEGYDGTWRERNGYDEGSFYDGFWDKKTRLDEGREDISALQAGLTSEDPDVRRATIYDEVDIPSWVNLAALSVLVRRFDWTVYHNMVLYRDTEGTGRWSTLPWDLDALTVPCCDGIGEYVHPFELEEDGRDQDLVVAAMMDLPEVREMFFRRLRDLADEHLASGSLEAALYAEHAAALPDLVASFDAWYDEHQAWIDQLIEDGHAPPGSTPRSPVGAIDEGGSPVDAVRQLEDHFLVDHVGPGELPEAASAHPEVLINEVHHQPAGGADHGFVELHNPSDEAVDLSGWTLEGVDAVIPHGTVLVAGGYAVLAADDPVLRDDTGGGLFLPAEYTNELDPAGTHLRLLDDEGAVVDEVRYDDAVPWPVVPTDHTLSRIDPSEPGSGFGAFAPSISAGGTPGAVNDPQPGTTLPVTFSDVPADHPFFGEVAWLVQHQVADGFEDGTFRPLAPVSRQAMAAFIHRLSGSPAPPPSAPTFSDVGPDHVFREEIAWLAGSGLSQGYADGTFRPAAPVSRQAMAAFIHRSAGSPALPSGAPTFRDVGPTNPFVTPIRWLAAVGVTTGYADGTFRPQAPVSRQAMAAFLYRASQLGG